MDRSSASSHTPGSSTWGAARRSWHQGSRISSLRLTCAALTSSLRRSRYGGSLLRLLDAAACLSLAPSLQQQAQAARFPSVTWSVADCRNLQHDLSSWLGRESRPSVAAAFDKGTADALLLFDEPAVAIRAYLGEMRALLSGGGGFLVVTCLREEGGILRGRGRPRLLRHINPEEWTIVTHLNDLTSDVGAGDDRSYDAVLLTPNERSF